MVPGPHPPNSHTFSMFTIRADISINTPAMQPTHFFDATFHVKQTKNSCSDPVRRKKMALGKDEREVGTYPWCMLVRLAGRRLMYKQNVFRVRS